MEIKNNTVVIFHYNLSEAGCEIIESSHDGKPMIYLHGHNNIIPGLEAALLGKQKGDCFSVTISPEDAYGVHKEELQQRISIKKFDKPDELKPGTLAAISKPKGPEWATVLKVGKFNVDIDTNHPLAGKTLVFNIEVLGVREATLEELTQGHVKS